MKALCDLAACQFGSSPAKKKKNKAIEVNIENFEENIIYEKSTAESSVKSGRKKWNEKQKYVQQQYRLRNYIKEMENRERKREEQIFCGSREAGRVFPLSQFRACAARSR